ncbi:MAG: alanine--tRNA ligase-related protein, partial [Hyphomicrobium sp.]
LSGEVAFKLYDTFGFPLDLTQDVLRGRNLGVDVAGFDAAMAKQKAAARESWTGSGETGTSKLWFDLKDELGATEFLGYSTEIAQGVMTALVKDGVRVKEAKVGDKVQIIVNQTPFYGESGGQVGDTGVMVSAKGGTVQITDTQKQLGALWVHEGQVTHGTLNVDDSVNMTVDHARRSIVRANHSATHLLHEALRRRLGTHVAQKGSLVTQEKLRFDVSQPTPITANDLAEVEAEVNRRVLLNSEVLTRLMTPDEAVKEGAMALFGEKYGDEVRVVSMGGHGAEGFSVELCGGTHVRRTGDIGAFKIVAESGVAAGVRRVEAVTGDNALAYLQSLEGTVAQLAGTLKAAPADVPARLTQVLDQVRALEKELASLKGKLASAQGDDLLSKAVDVNGLKVL